MKNIIHMSDLHIGYRDFKDRFIDIVDHLKAQISTKASHYVVVITGDIVNNANKEGSYEDARQGLDYLKQCGFKDVLMIPGNHDYGTGSRGTKKFVALFKETFYGADCQYPKVDIIDGVAFIGLDSMAAELRWYNEIWAQGQLGKSQLASLENILHQDKIRACTKRIIYLHHHPFKWRPLHELKDARKLKKVLTESMRNGISVDALLFGHNHEGHAHNGKWGIPRCYDAGTATLKPRSKYINWATWFQVQASIRMIDLTKDPTFDHVLPAIFVEKVFKK
ncbi:metallophosphoesterase family protein [Candidatus Omnitrophota bacterium]